MADPDTKIQEVAQRAAAMVERLRQDPGDLDARAKLARALMRLGRVAEAVKHYEIVAAADPGHRRAHMAIAAFRAKQDGDEAGRALMVDYFKRHPWHTKIPEGCAADAPAVLKVRGLDRTRLILFQSGSKGVSPRFRGGHYTTSYLMPVQRVPVHTYTIADDNMLAPGAVPPHALILNTIAEPDIEGRSLRTLQTYLEQHPGTAVINRPDRVEETARDRNYERLQGFAGIRFPRTTRITLGGEGADEVIRHLARLGFDLPLIIREVGTQTGRTTARIDTLEDLEAYVGQGLHGTWYVIRYHPIYWRDDIFRKLRLFHIGGKFYPVVCHLDRIWNVHGSNRKTMMMGNEELMGEEKRFLGDWRSYVGAPAADALDRLAEFVGLDFFGVDFTIDDEGNVFIYELNPAMRHSFDHAKNFPYKLPYDVATTAAFTRMVEGRLQAAAETASPRSPGA